MPQELDYDRIAMDAILRARQIIAFKLPAFSCVISKLAFHIDYTLEAPAAVDADMNLWINPKIFVEMVEETEAHPLVIAIALLIHEALHVVALHPIRRGVRDPIVWNVACDYVVNTITFDVVPTAIVASYAEINRIVKVLLYDHTGAARLMSAEQIYDKIYNKVKDKQGTDKERRQLVEEEAEALHQKPDTEEKKPKEKKKKRVPLDDHKSWTSAPTKKQVNDYTDVAREFKRILENSPKTMGDISDAISRLVDYALAYPAAWDTYIPLFMQHEYYETYVPPYRQFIYRGLYLPSLETEPRYCVIALDVSGSISDEELSKALYVAADLLSKYGLSAYVVQQDSNKKIDEKRQVMYVYPHTAHAVFSRFERKFDGGTDFAPVFAWVKERGLKPSFLVYFTDLMGNFPKEVPLYPVIWAVYGPSYRTNPEAYRKAPFGYIGVFE